MHLLHNDHLLYMEDLYYHDKCFHVPNEINNFFSDEWTDKVPDPDAPQIILDEPYLIIETLDSCYSHALLDRIFPLYVATKSIRMEYPTIRIMIRNNMIRRFPTQNFPIIDRDAGYYGGFHQNYSHGSAAVHHYLYQMMAGYIVFGGHLYMPIEMIFNIVHGIKNIFIPDGAS